MATGGRKEHKDDDGKVTNLFGGGACTAFPGDRANGVQARPLNGVVGRSARRRALPAPRHRPACAVAHAAERVAGGDGFQADQPSLPTRGTKMQLVARRCCHCRP